MATHINKLENLAFRFKTLNSDIPETMLISKILTTLPERYNHFHNAWESTSLENKTLANLTTSLSLEEKRYYASYSRDDSDFLAFRTNVKKCFQCWSDRHLSSFHKTTNNTNRGQNNSTIRCFSCTGIGHSRSKRSICHMTNDDSFLLNAKPVNTYIGLAQKSSSMTVEKVGKIMTDCCELKEAMYVPELSKNILSVDSITRNGSEVSFTENKSLL
ncbi:hypothetical protein PR048_011212 [Dryococelus australis]|uniref:Retrovirus-related Pol polyprotein from transposon TNT 1-94-like beta-barrel domain-containing protein n=1 Tax=Dryococelus australis TaxID=614101 RepID=A0ABQ9HKW9_9NEOP|nr:hypothetical protein PR048_011212 [Dryococelus australis]